MFQPILAETAGSAAIITALGGVFVSLATVYLNSKKQTTATEANKDQITVLTDQISDLISPPYISRVEYHCRNNYLQRQF